MQIWDFDIYSTVPQLLLKILLSISKRLFTNTDSLFTHSLEYTVTEEHPHSNSPHVFLLYTETSKSLFQHVPVCRAVTTISETLRS